jgi:urease subunit alpha
VNPFHIYRRFDAGLTVGAFGKAAGATSLVFVSEASLKTVDGYALSKGVSAVRGCRVVSKNDLKLNNFMPQVEIDPRTFRVVVNGEQVVTQPAKKLPLTQLYNLF